MEIFKAAANQAMNANINPSQQNQIETRQIEHTDIEENVTANKNQNLKMHLTRSLTDSAMKSSPKGQKR